MVNYWIEVTHGNGGPFWRIKSHNGETIAHSEVYATKWNARRAAKKLSWLTGLPWFDDTK